MSGGSGVVTVVVPVPDCDWPKTACVFHAKIAASIRARIPAARLAAIKFFLAVRNSIVSP
jgi:hypothetical protein